MTVESFPDIWDTGLYQHYCRVITTDKKTSCATIRLPDLFDPGEVQVEVPLHQIIFAEESYETF